MTRTDERPAAVRGTADYHLRMLDESKATLTAEQLDRLAGILRPALGARRARASARHAASSVDGGGS